MAMDSANQVMSPLERARIAAKLSIAVAEHSAVPEGAVLARVQAARRVVDLCAQLGATKPMQQRSILRDIAAGDMDAKGLQDLLDVIQNTVTEHGGPDAMSMELQKDAQAAITHWAKLEETSDV